MSFCCKTWRKSAVRPFNQRPITDFLGTKQSRREASTIQPVLRNIYIYEATNKCTKHFKECLIVAKNIHNNSLLTKQNYFENKVI